MPATTRKNKYAPNSWSKEILVDLDCPSGQLCQVRRLGADGLIRAGLFDKLDILGSVVGDHIDEAEGRPKKPQTQAEQVQDLMANKEKLGAAMELIDQVASHVVVQPQLWRAIRVDDAGKPVLDDEGDEQPLPEEERVPGRIYTDMVELEDKMFIFQFVVGGSADLATFRKEFGGMLGGMAISQSIQLPAE